ncbi:helix-turn-helix domain-containing protein [Larkinella sp. VNQ87]|uniref:helix-turn-helix domain-containing protein n=1 Tax=Larkinella sp. VNQ87 TaxID=3400921 RepID=UPI003BFC44F8
METETDLTDKMLRLRHLFGYSQEFLALQLGITQSAYSQLENGKSKLSLKRMKKLVAVYGLSPSDFLTQNSPDLLNQAVRTQPFRQKWASL